VRDHRSDAQGTIGLNLVQTRNPLQRDENVGSHRLLFDHDNDICPARNQSCFLTIFRKEGKRFVEGFWFKIIKFFIEASDPILPFSSPVERARIKQFYLTRSDKTKTVQ